MPTVNNLSTFLASPSSYDVVGLSDQNISYQDCIKIANAIKNNNAITRLLLGSNQIGDEGAIVIGEALKSNNSIDYLSLRSNKIGDAGTVAILDGIKDNTQLTHLYLQDNQIGDTGAVAIGEWIKTSNSIFSISLQCNQIGDVGAIALREPLKISSITFLDLYCNQIGDAVAKSMRPDYYTSKLELDLSFQSPPTVNEDLSAEENLRSAQLTRDLFIFAFNNILVSAQQLMEYLVNRAPDVLDVNKEDDALSSAVQQDINEESNDLSLLGENEAPTN